MFFRIVRKFKFAVGFIFVLFISTAHAEIYLECEYSNGVKWGTGKYEFFITADKFCSGDMSMARKCGPIYSNFEEAFKLNASCNHEMATCLAVAEEEDYFRFQEVFLGQLFNAGTLDRVTGRTFLLRFKKDEEAT